MNTKENISVSWPLKKQYLLYAIALSLVEFIIFKILYPFPDFYADSYWYIIAASQGADIAIWPIGYSKFLAGFHMLTHSDTALVTCQFLLMQVAALYFYFTILHFFKTNRSFRIILFIFLFANPLTFYLCNLISSDALFGALTLLWLTELIRVIRRPQLYQILSHSVLLFLCFTIRNTAYYYLFITALAFILSNQALWRKLIGIILPILFLVPFIRHTENAAYKLTGTRQYSLFTGWQLANNALYIYPHITIDSTSLSTPEAKELNRIVIEYFRSKDYLTNRELVGSFAGNYYIVSPTSPLRRYVNLHGKGSGAEFWGRMSASFEPFGRSILLHHPVAYTRYFVLLNCRHYFLPQLSDQGQYNGGSNEIYDPVKNWFDYPNNRIRCISFDLQGYLSICAVLFLLLNIYCIYQFVLLFIKIRPSRFFTRSYAVDIFLAGYLVTNFIFSISVAINILRYQYIPMFILLATSLLISEHLAGLSSKSK